MSNTIRDRIDTKAGITEALGNGESLTGFTALTLERSRWRKEHPDEPLNEWYVFNGRVFLDKFGQVHTVTCEGQTEWVQPGAKRPELNVTWSSRSVPRGHDRCLHCDGTFRSRDLGKIFVVGYDHEMDRLEVWHNECRVLWIDEARRRAFRVAFENAKLNAPTFHGMPSQYSDTMWTGPWYRVESVLGQLLIGWRKSVIHLGWDKSTVLHNVDGKKLFAEEDVTKDTKMIHAWGTDKLSEYLRRLHLAA